MPIWRWERSRRDSTRVADVVVPPFILLRIASLLVLTSSARLGSPAQPGVAVPEKSMSCGRKWRFEEFLRRVRSGAASALRERSERVENRRGYVIDGNTDWRRTQRIARSDAFFEAMVVVIVRMRSPMRFMRGAESRDALKCAPSKRCSWWGGVTGMG